MSPSPELALSSIRKMSAKRPRDRSELDAYRTMRTAAATPEPFGGGTGRTGLFVVQKHAATRLHYDFRLELDGVLKSWAVPRGPSLDPQIKRLAVHVEDHPVEYGDFEGVIPEGNYGAGAVVLWDQGRWEPLEDPRDGLQRGKLLFELHGYKLGGVWTLVRTKRGSRDGPQPGESREWLLIKKPDAYSTATGPKQVPETSILSGLTVEQMGEGGGRRRREALTAVLEQTGARRADAGREGTAPMLARSADAPFTDDDWIFEMKYDGFRLLAQRRATEVRLLYRSGIDATELFPEVARAVRALPFESFTLDGEVVVLDAQARPVFQRLQRRVQLSRHADIQRATVEHPATLYLFDALELEGYDLRQLTTVQRKDVLREVVPPVGPLRFADHVVGQGEALFEQVEAFGLEGIMAKKASARYQGGRHDTWLKIRVQRTGDFVIVGYRPRRGARREIGALHLGVYEDGILTYAGRVGTGFSERELMALREGLDAIVVSKPPLERGTWPRSRGHVWVEPRLVCEVRFKERTEDGALRHPSFVRLRDDKAPEECVWEAGVEASEAEHEPPAAEVVRPRPPREVTFTNLDKIFWPAEGYTKGDLIAFYRDISAWLLPYLRDRPVVLTRYPDGIDGKSFFQKDAPSWVPDWVRTERMWSEHAEREIDYFVCDDVETLVFLANLGTIPLHVWSSRLSFLSRPDWCIIDLDPKGAPFADVVTLARSVHALCEEIELPSYVKTSGSTGLHVLIPLGGQCTYEQSRSLAELIVRVIAAQHSDIATIARQVGRRGGRVYLDYLQNGHGRLLVSPFSVRPKAGATVSAPLRWREVSARLDIDRFTIRTMLRRMGRMKEDPLSAVLEDKPDLEHALELLGQRV